MPNYKVIDADKFDADLKTLADGIRAKLNTNAPLHFPDEMAEAIRTRGAKIIPKTITENGEYKPEDENADGYAPLTIAVPDSSDPFFEGTSSTVTLKSARKINSNFIFN
jgi:hypothetical protein